MGLFQYAWKEDRRSRTRSRSRSRSRREDRTPIRRSSRASSSKDLPIKQDEQWEWSSNSWWSQPSQLWSDHRQHPTASSPKHKRSKDQDVKLPSHFKSDEYYLDKGNDRDLPLPRRVMSTEFTMAKGTADCEVTNIPLHKLLYKGIANWTLRLVAAGKPVFFVLVKSYQLSIFMYQLTRTLKDVNIEEVAIGWNRAKPSPDATNSEEERHAVIKQYAVHISEHIAKTTSNDDALYKRIKELESELLNAKSSTKNKDNKKSADVTFSFACNDQTKHLQTDCPTSKILKEINAYSNRILKKPDQKCVSKVTIEVKDQICKLHNNKDTQIDFARAALIGWGMPVALAAQFEFDNACKVIAIVSLIS